MELPPGRGSAREGAELYKQKACAVCHGADGNGGPGSRVEVESRPGGSHLATGAHTAAALAVCDDGVGLHQSRDACWAKRGRSPPDEVYALTAYLLYINQVIPEDEVLDAQSLPKVKMPIGDAYADLPDWKPRTRRLQGYPY